MNNILKGLLVFTLALCFNACTDKIDVDLPNGGERLIIEASINWEKGTSGELQTIKLSKSTPYFNEDKINPVDDASVVITKENDGAQFVFHNQNNGKYKATDFIPELNATYSLEIHYKGQIYQAKETLIPVSNINRIEQDIEGSGGVGENEILVKAFFDDPNHTDNYYLGEFIPSHKPLNGLQAIKDEFTNGNENFVEYEDQDLLPGDEVVINIYGISNRTYNYLSLLIQQSFGFDGPFQTTPVQLKGNCKNINNSEEEVLGFFRLSEFATTSYTIK